MSNNKKTYHSEEKYNESFFIYDSGTFRFTPSLYTYKVLQNDIFTYINNGGKSQNEFFNLVLLNSFHEDSAIDVYTQLKNHIESILIATKSTNTNFTKLAKSNYIKKLKDEHESILKQNGKTLRITPCKEVEEAIGKRFELIDSGNRYEKIRQDIECCANIRNINDLMCFLFCKERKTRNTVKNDADNNATYYHSPSTYIRAVFEKYASLPASEREEILYAKKLIDIKHIIEKNKSKYEKIYKSLYTIGKIQNDDEDMFEPELIRYGGDSFLPLWFDSNPLKEKLYLVVYKIPANNNNFTTKRIIENSYDITYEHIEVRTLNNLHKSIHNLCSHDHKISYLEYKHIMETAERKIQQKNIENLSSTIFNFTILLTQRGMDLFYIRTHFRPSYSTLIKITGLKNQFEYLMTFNSTLHQIKHYFKTFGSHVYVINNSVHNVTISFDCTYKPTIKEIDILTKGTDDEQREIKKIINYNSKQALVTIENELIKLFNGLCNIKQVSNSNKKNETKADNNANKLSEDTFEHLDTIEESFKLTFGKIYNNELNDFFKYLFGNNTNGEFKKYAISNFYDKIINLENPYHHAKVQVKGQKKIIIKYSNLTDLEAKFLTEKYKHITKSKNVISKKNIIFSLDITSNPMDKYPLMRFFEQASHLYDLSK